MSVIKLANNWERISVGEHVFKIQNTNNSVLFVGNPAPISGGEFVEWLKQQPSTNGVYWNGEGFYNETPFNIFNCVFWIINPSVEVMRVKFIDNNGNVVLARTKIDGEKNLEYTLPLCYEEGFEIEFDSEADVGMADSDQPLDLLDYFSLNPKAYVQPWHNTMATGAMHTSLSLFGNINTPADIVTGYIKVPLAIDGAKTSLLVGSTRPLKTAPAREKYVLTLTTDAGLKEDFEETDVFDSTVVMETNALEYTLNGNKLFFPFQHWSAVSADVIIPHKVYNRSTQLAIMEYTNEIMQECGKMFSTKVQYFSESIDYYRISAIEAVDESVIAVQ